MFIFSIQPRRGFALITLACVAMLGFALYLQQVGGLEPCPMCIVQRYALIGVALLAGLAALGGRRWAFMSFGILSFIASVFGAFVAARQSWIQWYPPETASCGRDFYGMIENFSLKRVIPMIFKGSGDCTKVDWTLFGGSIANWSFVCFAALGLCSFYLVLKSNKTH